MMVFSVEKFHCLLTHTNPHPFPSARQSAFQSERRPSGFVFLAEPWLDRPLSKFDARSVEHLVQQKLEVDEKPRVQRAEKEAIGHRVVHLLVSISVECSFCL